MCGISGFQGPWRPDLLRAMNSMQIHRGPDGQGEFWEPGIGLAHVRLSILDLSESAAQPMQTEEGRYILSYNGEIYNFRELRLELEKAGHTFRSKGDTEVLLHGIATHGATFLKRLNGVFAFALWDKESATLLLARDGMGVKPLYYSQLSKGFLFASELKALLTCDDIPRDIDCLAMHHYLAYLWSPGERTMLSGVSKLLPGEAMEVRDGRILRRWFFYDLPYEGKYSEASEDELVAELREKLDSAVERQMVSDVPVGAFLSGGLDSSAVVAMMTRHVEPGVLPCYSIGFKKSEGKIDGNPADLPYARKVAGYFGVELHTIEVESNIIEQLPRMLFLLDEPQADPAPINALLIAEQARRDGVKVLLSGTGGDDIFTGYRRHTALLAERYWGGLPKFFRKGLARTARLVREGGGGPWAHSPQLRRLAKMFSYADADADTRLVDYFIWSTERLRRGLYSAELASALAGQRTEKPLLDTLRRIPQEQDRLNRLLYLETKHFLADHNLNYMDKTGMAAGVEVRVPLIDPELVRFATRIPTRLKQKGRIGKAIFKKAMEPYLPREIIYRPKSGFGAPLRYWLRNQLHDMVEEVLSPDSLRRRGLFDPGSVKRLIQLDKDGRVDEAYTIFSLMCIELWCRQFLDRGVPGY